MMCMSSSIKNKIQQGQNEVSAVDMKHMKTEFKKRVAGLCKRGVVSSALIYQTTCGRDEVGTSVVL